MLKVVEADKYFLQLTNEMLRTARIKVISRGAVWSVEIQTGKWEQYSYKMNEQIENAHSSSRLFVSRSCSGCQLSIIHCLLRLISKMKKTNIVELIFPRWRKSIKHVQEKYVENESIRHYLT